MKSTWRCRVAQSLRAWITRRSVSSGFAVRPSPKGSIHEVDGVPVRIYGVEKTLADCFKYRNKIGLETAVEA